VNRSSQALLSEFRVLSFDCYGTFIDWDSGILEALKPLMERLDPQPDPCQVLGDFGRIETQLEAECLR
jgi:2-haloacid dehalogenase